MNGLLRCQPNVIPRRAGLDQYTRSALLGHASPKTSGRYDHLVPDELHEARERKEEALGRYVSQGSTAGVGSPSPRGPGGGLPASERCVGSNEGPFVRTFRQWWD